MSDPARPVAVPPGEGRTIQGPAGGLLTFKVRAEQTNIKAEGPRTDPTLNFQRDASGRPIVGADGRPVPIGTDALGISQRTFLDRGLRAEKEYLRRSGSAPWERVKPFARASRSTCR